MAVTIVKSHMTTSNHVRKADTKVVVNQQLELEDEFKSLYDADKNSTLILQPPFNILQLSSLCSMNNILRQCIHAMEVNIDGTGHTIELNKDAAEKEEEEYNNMIDNLWRRR